MTLPSLSPKVVTQFVLQAAAVVVLVLDQLAADGVELTGWLSLVAVIAGALAAYRVNDNGNAPSTQHALLLKGWKAPRESDA